MGHITVTETVAAPAEAAFAYVDDHRNTTKYMKDLTKWAPAGDKVHGKGATFEVAMKAGPMTLSSVVEITTWTENKAIGWTSREGFKQTGKWSFKAHASGCDATFDMDYELPGGIAGRMLSRAAEPIVRGNIEQSVRALRTQVEKAAKGAKPAAKKATTAKATAKPGSRSAKTSTKPGGRRS
ncbi:MAG: SRPBCC family protein [Candidatus Dormibacteria bacterium]